MSASKSELDLHRRLLEGEETASSEICERFLDPLIQDLNQYNRKVADRDSSLIPDAVVEALLNYIDEPGKFDPKRGDLYSYLRMSAEGDLKNLLDKEKRRTRNQENLEGDVEVDRKSRNSPLQLVSIPDQEAEKQELREKLRDILQNEKDVEVAEMILDGIRKTEHYADVLSLSDLPIEKQREEVKRTKDRIKKALKRADWEGFVDLNN